MQIQEKEEHFWAKGRARKEEPSPVHRFEPQIDYNCWEL